MIMTKCVRMNPAPLLTALLMVVWSTFGAGVSEAEAACLQTPIPGTTITSNFGLRFHPIKKTWKPHNGTDMRAQMFTPVSAANTGVVTYSGYMGSAGNTIIITGNDGIQTRYYHLAKAGVPMGVEVSAGQKIALSGKSGHASYPPHLHFEARSGGGSQPVDARQLLCQALPEKNGAGPDKSGDGKPAPQGPSAPIGSQDPSGQPGFVSMPDFNGYDGMSDMELMRLEAERRLLNEDWHIILGGCGRDINQEAIDGQPAPGMDCETFIGREMIAMRSFGNWIKSRKIEAMERIESMMAVKNLENLKIRNAGKLDRLADQARKMNAQ